MVGEDRVAGNVFTWSFKRAQLTLSQDGDSWCVVCWTESPLLGPNMVTYEARHRQPMHAAWDVWSRVKRATEDGEEGVRVATQAAQWMSSKQ